MFLTNLFNLTKECSHERVAPDLDFSYCPDCGKLIYNEWYITRCACCGIKLKTNSRNDKIYPQYGFAKHKGYGTAQHIKAIKEHGICKIHRKTFVKNFIHKDEK